ncbi:DUF3558 domain-containing protein [Nocardia paucivorans]|uniref:DUF3558 domain-containing protein n=1 Tax=Nocardia paucivorans TaxID=114259 RepID=UPI001FE04DC3|nr:DUF3558 domain-containing protein [Nocardia paucivorans]
MALLGLVVGCSSEVDGQPEAQGQSTANGDTNVEYNPCTDLSDEALRATRVDPATKDADIDPPEGPSTWRICAWDSIDGPYFVSVASTTHRQDELYSNPAVTGFRSVQVNERSGLSFYSSSDADHLSCYVSFPAKQGMFNVIVDWRYGERESMPQSPPCDLAIRHARELEPFLPK